MAAACMRRLNPNYSDWLRRNPADPLWRGACMYGDDVIDRPNDAMLRLILDRNTD